MRNSKKSTLRFIIFILRLISHIFPNNIRPKRECSRECLGQSKIQYIISFCKRNYRVDMKLTTIKYFLNDFTKKHY